ncbi:MAG: radical SAM protein [Ignavibacteria bacterium]|jgi:7-carboxy-7-deazaguanine synthase|nr:radical SAM protein [Ignavibacteria bacterium]
MELCINEIFYSLQGEGTRAGIPCVFIRLAGCNLLCKWCDTKYAINKLNGKNYSVENIINEIKKYDCNFVEITGGEPLLQDEIYGLTEILLANNFTVAIETNGSILLDKLNKKIIKIMDVKCPESGMSEYNNYNNFQELTEQDEIKFVIASENDYYFGCKVIEMNELWKRTKNLIFSAVTEYISHKKLAELILNSKNTEYKKYLRMQIQLHKIIWGEDAIGV